jgi:prepilin signal peptidase PulO-like enzyme (type II secretory pathway)
LIGFTLSFFEGGIGWLTSLLGIITCGGGLLLFSIVSTKIMKREGMGFGDVKLFASYGAIMGTELTFLTLMMGATLAIAVIIPFRFFTKKEMHLPLPFGPFLGVAALASYLYGDFIFEVIFGFVDGVLF